MRHASVNNKLQKPIQPPLCRRCAAERMTQVIGKWLGAAGMWISATVKLPVYFGLFAKFCFFLPTFCKSRLFAAFAICVIFSMFVNFLERTTKTQHTYTTQLYKQTLAQLDITQ